MIIVHSEADRHSEGALAVYRTFGKVVLGHPDRDWLRRRLRDADVLVVRLGVSVDRELLGWGKRLRIVASPTTGREHIDLDTCAAHGVMVLSFAGQTHLLENVTATAEHTVGLMLALLRGTVRANSHVMNGGWDRNLFVGRELRALTVGLVGLGRLGSRVGRYVRSFGASVVAHDPFAADDRFAVLGITRVSLAELVGRSDIVSLHASVTPATRGIMDSSLFAQVRPGTLLVNTARGELVDEPAMLEALRKGILAGVAVDVLCGEPDPSATRNALVKLAAKGANIILTPHIGGCTGDSLVVAEQLMAQMVSEALEVSDEGSVSIDPSVPGR